MRIAPRMPEEYKAQDKKKPWYMEQAPRDYTPQEIEWIKQLRSEGYTMKEIAESVDRTHDAIKIKLKRLQKKTGTYNQNHYEDKYETNYKFLELVKPKTVLDLYCGEKNFYQGYKTTTNDINPAIEADHHEDALKLLCRLYSGGGKI